MKVYKIKLEGDYTEYFVLASSFNDAERKIKVQMKEKKEVSSKNIFGKDGSIKDDFLRPELEKEIIVKEIMMLSDKIIK